MKRRRRVKRERVEAADRVGPTPETAAKLRPDPLRELHAADFLPPEAVDAAREIAAVHAAVTRGLDCRAADLQRSGRGRAEIPDSLARAYADRYCPWADQMGRWGRRMKSPALLTSLVWLIVDGAAIELAALIAGLKPHRMRVVLKLSLLDYNRR